ncbi:MAG: hypothetical protein NTZ60_08000 [Campylobacterales bacterium]|nr:hypothetical protein [Campylobacterales bacterium]
MKLVLFLLFIGLFALYGASYSTSANWLVELNTTSVQMEAIQKQFRGFDTAMMEVGYRYAATKKAMSEGNFSLASYHWDKIKTAIDNGTIRRPARKSSSEIFFLDGIYNEFRDALQSKNSVKINQIFTQVAPLCNACHNDQKVGFIVID